MGTNAISRRGIRLTPLDTLFFRDGRPFDAANRVSSILPFPQTVAGSLRSALLGATGFDFGRFRSARRHLDIQAALSECGADERIVNANFLGPWLSLTTLTGASRSGVPLFACPEILRRVKSEGTNEIRWWRGAPINKPAGWLDDRLQPIGYANAELDKKAATSLLTLNGLKKFLAGGVPAREDCLDYGKLVHRQSRVGIVIDGDRLATRKGDLYAIELLTLGTKGELPDCEIEIYCEIQAEESLLQALDGLCQKGWTIPIGGEGKYAAVSTQKAMDWPSYDGTRKSSVWYLATPTFLDGESNRSRYHANRPIPKNVEVIAAASGSPLPVSGWDIARNCPRPVRFAIPAGATYFVRNSGNDHGFLEGPEAETLRQEGWGFALQGKWED